MEDRCFFRAWCREVGKMVHFKEGSINLVQQKDNMSKAGLFFPLQGDQFYFASYETMQSVGIKDKNGKLIYEDDLVEDDEGRLFSIKFSTHFQETRLYPVNAKAKKSAAGYGSEKGKPILGWIYPRMELKVVGNIYENKELMSATNDE